MANSILRPNREEIPAHADVIVIGGGPAGTAALWAIERAAPGTKTVLIEKNERLAGGSTLASLENFRTCWPTPCLARQMQRSIEVFKNADELIVEGAQQSLAIKQQGYLYCALNDAQAETLRQDVAHLHSMGMDHIEYLQTADIQRRFAWLGNRVIAAKYDPTAGWLDSNALIHAYARSTPSATILLGIQDVQIQVENERIRGVTIPQGNISAPVVIIAAGAGARQVGRTAGIELPITLIPRQSFTTPTRHAAYPEDGPCVISGPPYAHLRPEARDGAIFGWEYEWIHKESGARSLDEPIYPVESLKDPRFPSAALALLAKQFGHRDGEGFSDPRYLRGISHNIGYYVYRTNTYTISKSGAKHHYESQRAIIGPWPEITGLYLSVAHVGHGIMASAASGEIIAAHVLKQPLPDLIFADFERDVHHVEHDGGGL